MANPRGTAEYPTAEEGIDRVTKNANTNRTSTSFCRWAPLLFSKTIVRQSVKEERVSMAYWVLPMSIQNRLPPLPSLRRSVSLPMRRRNGSGSYISSGSSGTTTPESEPEMENLIMDRSIPGVFDIGKARSDYRPGLSVPPPRHSPPSGVDWRCGQQGMGLIVNGYQESKSDMNSNYNPRFERTAYVDGVAYLLKGLPRDLDETEISVLQRSMPPCVGDRFLDEDEAASAASDATGKNVVHSGLLFMLIYVLACIRWAAPYILLFFSQLMRYEREYKVSENVLGTTMAGMTVWLGAMRRFGDGVAGQVLSEAFDYTAEGVSGALKDFAREVGQSNATAPGLPRRRRPEHHDR